MLELGLVFFFVRIRASGEVCAGVWVRVKVNPTWITVAILELI